MSENETNELAKSVAAVMAKIERLRKADDNKFANYRFTSVDDYKDVIRPLMAENGLTVCMSETHFKTFTHTKEKKESEHCCFHFDIWLEHASGDKGEKEGTTVCLPYAMAQTTGQARSYALKEWLKSKFLASSGDLAEDADSQNYDIKLTKAQARDVHESLMRDLQEFATEGTKQDLMDWSDKNKVLLDAMPNDWAVFLRNEFKQAQIAIQIRERGGTIETTDYDGWMKGFEDQCAAASTLEDLHDVWGEHQGIIHEMPSSFQATANRIFNNNELRFDDGTS